MALFSKRQPGGVVVLTDDDTTGTHFFVDSNSATGADSAGYGRDPDEPCLTIDYAVGLCTANKGDRINVMPGHTETIAGATGLVVDVAGVQIVGLGYGSEAPLLTFSAAASTISHISYRCGVQYLKYPMLL
jgi:hypothetical protein